MSDKPCVCNLVQTEDCNQFEVVTLVIRYCPLHKAAPKLLAACEAVRKHMDSRSYGVRAPVLEQMLDDAIDAAKEGK